MRKHEKPTTEIVDYSSGTEEVEKHPAYGQITGSRVSSGGGATLYGSDFKHSNYIIISVHASELHRNLSSDWHFAREKLCEVALSEAQWATFVSSLNAGMGVPCTLEYVAPDGTGHVSGIDRSMDRRAQAAKELVDHLNEAVARCKALTDTIEAMSLPKKHKDALLHQVGMVIQQIKSNTPFVATQFDKHIEATVEKAKVEVNAYVHQMIARAGLKQLGAPLLQLPGDTDDTSQEQ